MTVATMELQGVAPEADIQASVHATREATMVPRNAAQAYSNVGIETGVHAASPAQLVVMLYDGALLAIADAERYIGEKRIADKGQAISRAITIIDNGLRASLDLQSNPLAGQLEQLYEYMSRRLLLGSVRNDTQVLQEVARLLTELLGAWAQLATSNRNAMATSNAAASRQPRAARP